jgi:hypothetical protein
MPDRSDRRETLLEERVTGLGTKLDDVLQRVDRAVHILGNLGNVWNLYVALEENLKQPAWVANQLFFLLGDGAAKLGKEDLLLALDNLDRAWTLIETRLAKEFP